MFLQLSFYVCWDLWVSKILKSNLYRHIEWPIVIMLAAMIPIGQALESTGITALIATEVVSLAGDLLHFLGLDDHSNNYDVDN